MLTFTACRIGDARLLGPMNEVNRGGVTHIEWQPEKKHAAFVSIPMAAPLCQAIQDTAHELVSPRCKPFAAPDSLSQRFSKWCREAGLEGKTALGVRKTVGYMLAVAGCTQYQIMAIHGHTESRTSEIYTKAASRRILAGEAATKMHW